MLYRDYAVVVEQVKEGPLGMWLSGRPSLRALDPLTAVPCLCCNANIAEYLEGEGGLSSLT